jgi:YgiT-type zinc finger domain-containing protein
MGREPSEKEEKMNCMSCRGKMERGHAPFHIDRKDYHLILDKVPAWVCGQCGDAYFEESEVEAIQEMISALDQGTEKIALSA